MVAFQVLHTPTSTPCSCTPPRHRVCTRRMPAVMSACSWHQGAQKRRLPGLPVVLLSSISAAFLTVAYPFRQALTPYFVWLGCPNCARTLGTGAATHRAQG